jgi:hypothetical protein
MDGAAFLCRLARCRDVWIAQRMRANAAARASPDAEPPTPATHVATTEAFEAFRLRPEAAPASK